LEIVPFANSAPRSAKLVKGSTLKIYPGAPHGLATIRADEFNADLLEFIQSGSPRVSESSGARPLTH
jgi:non-heme chloroperoxidase